MKTILMGGDALITQEFWSITGDAGENTLMTFSPDPRKNPAAAELVKRFKDKGIEPEGYVLYTYAALQAWKQAAEKAKSVERDEIVKALNDTEFDTVVGKFKFNEKGDPNLPPYAVYRWSNGTYEQIDPPASPPAAVSGRTSNSLRPARPAACRVAQSRPTTRPKNIPTAGYRFFAFARADFFLAADFFAFALFSGFAALAAGFAAAGFAGRAALATGGLLPSAFAAAAAPLRCSATCIMSSSRPFENSPSFVT